MLIYWKPIYRNPPYAIEPLFKPEDFPQLSSVVKTSGKMDNPEQILAKAGAPETGRDENLSAVIDPNSQSTRGSAVPWESALMRSRPKSPDGISPDADDWDDYIADVMETDDEDGNIDVPLKYLPEPKLTSEPVRNYRSTVGNGMRHAPTKKSMGMPQDDPRDHECLRRQLYHGECGLRRLEQHQQRRGDSRDDGGAGQWGRGPCPRHR